MVSGLWYGVYNGVIVGLVEMASYAELLLVMGPLAWALIFLTGN